MTIAITDSQRKAARVAGLAYLLPVIAVMIANLGIHARLIVAGNLAQTARNIVVHERLFRVSIACELFYSVGVVVLLAALFVILEPVNRNLALLAAFARFVYAATWVLMTLELFEVLRLLSGAEYLRAFEVDRLQALAKLSLRARFDEYYAGLLFYAIASTVCAFLWLQSHYIPKALAAWGVISSAWCAACTLVLFVFPTFPSVVNLWWFDTPMAIFEIATSFWLLFKGLTPRAGVE